MAHCVDLVSSNDDIAKLASGRLHGAVQIDLKIIVGADHAIDVYVAGIYCQLCCINLNALGRQVDRIDNVPRDNFGNDLAVQRLQNRLSLRLCRSLCPIRGIVGSNRPRLITVPYLIARAIPGDPHVAFVIGRSWRSRSNKNAGLTIDLVNQRIRDRDLFPAASGPSPLCTIIGIVPDIAQVLKGLPEKVGRDLLTIRVKDPLSCLIQQRNISVSCYPCNGRIV